MGPSALIFEHHEFPDVFLQPFSFEQNAEYHVHENSGKQDRRRSCGSKTEADQLGIKKPTEGEENLFYRFVCFGQPGESVGWIRVPSQEAQGNRCKAEAKSGNKMTIRSEAQGNLCGVVRVQEAQGNRCEVSITSLKGQGWNTTMCHSPTVDTLRKSDSLRRRTST